MDDEVHWGATACVLEIKPAYSVGEMLTQHLDELEEEAERWRAAGTH